MAKILITFEGQTKFIEIEKGNDLGGTGGGSVKFSSNLIDCDNLSDSDKNEIIHALVNGWESPIVNLLENAKNSGKLSFNEIERIEFELAKRESITLFFHHYENEIKEGIIRTYGKKNVGTTQYFAIYPTGRTVCFWQKDEWAIPKDAEVPIFAYSVKPITMQILLENYLQDANDYVGSRWNEFVDLFKATISKWNM